MTQLLRATGLIGRPVVTLSGESPLEVKDVVFEKDAGALLGFTLRKHGFLGGPVSEDLAWSDVHGLGPDAVMIQDSEVLRTEHGVSSASSDVIGSTVMSESGTELGEVVEVVIQVGASADVVGFEVEPSPELSGSGDAHVFIPLPDTMAISGEKIIVPDSAINFVRDDLAGFGAAVADFRRQLSGGA